MSSSLFQEVGKTALRWSVFGFSAFATVIAASIAYAAVPFGSLGQVTGGSGLTATMWNDLVTHVNQSVKQTTEVITVNGTNVGLGVPSPAQKLSVAGTVESTSGGFKFPDGTTQTSAAVSGKIVNVTMKNDCTRVVLSAAQSVTMTTFTVDKKQANSTLLIQGSISGHGNYSGEMTQGWKIGTSTEAVAQGIMYDENPYGKTQPTSAVISGYATTGPQTMTFRYYSIAASADRPFVVYNPNASDDTRLAQTCSTYTVWEIAP